MTVTADTRGAAMTDLAEDVQRRVREVLDRARGAATTEERKAIHHELSALYSALRDAVEDCSDVLQGVIKTRLVEDNVDYRAVYGDPYSAETVRQIARTAGVAVDKKKRTGLLRRPS